MNRISESELILPALFVIDRDGGTATTSQLIYELTNLLNPTGKDVEILSGRTDTKFSQKVRNLKSHNTLEARSFATHKKGRFAITQKEVDELRRHRLDLEPLFEFQLDSAAAELSQLAVGTRLHVIDERVVTEGELRWRSVEYQTRSKELRRSAVDHYLATSDEGQVFVSWTEDVSDGKGRNVFIAKVLNGGQKVTEIRQANQEPTSATMENLFKFAIAPGESVAAIFNTFATDYSKHG